MRRGVILAAAAACLVLAGGAPAQQPETRLIDTEPKVEMRPPASDVPAPRDPRMPAPPDARGTGDDRDLALDLEMKERRERRDGGSDAPSWVAAAVFVATAAVFLLVFGWAVRRRNR